MIDMSYDFLIGELTFEAKADTLTKQLLEYRVYSRTIIKPDIFSSQLEENMSQELSKMTTEELIEQLKTFPYLIDLLVEPTKEMQMAAVTAEPEVIALIDDPHPATKLLVL